MRCSLDRRPFLSTAAALTLGAWLGCRRDAPGRYTETDIAKPAAGRLGLVIHLAASLEKVLIVTKFPGDTRDPPCDPT